jgi:hypothetical protein
MFFGYRRKYTQPNRNRIIYALPMLLDMYTLYDDVFWFDIPMNNAVTV